MAEPDHLRYARMILSLRQAGFVDADILSSIEQIPRENFVDPDFIDQAYEDYALPIACGQTLMRISTDAKLLTALNLTSRRVNSLLEIGCGSGYLSAILARLVRRLYAIDRYRTLVEQARSTLARLNIKNVEFRHSDGLRGWAEAGPYDRILIAAAIEMIPEGLMAQLKPDGILVAPMGLGDTQSITCIRRDASGMVNSEALYPSAFLPIEQGIAKEL